MKVPQIRRPALAAGLGAVALLAAACGGSAAGTTPSTAPTTTPSTGAAQPGAFGTIAAVAGSTLQVQNPATGQVAVKYTPTTKISEEVTATRAAVVTGRCVTVTGRPGSSGTFTARTVLVDQSGAGCARRFTPRPGAKRSATPRPKASGSARARAARAALGTVTSVTPTAFVITGEQRARTGASASPTTITVTTDSATTYRQIVPATSAALKVGQCVAAVGTADTTGAVTARTIRVSAPGPNGCTAPGRRRFGASPAAAGGGTGA